nr:reverse transcriptase domain-containing protein [Tanacetum cinerariifolium]
MANVDDANRNPKPIEAPVARKCSYKEFMSFQPFNFKGSEGAIGLIRWFERTELVFCRSNCTEDCKVKFASAYQCSLDRRNDPGRLYSRNLLHRITYLVTETNGLKAMRHGQSVGSNPATFLVDHPETTG